ncbi:hypothetical protein OROGR_026397 [Orobanche gracilis]
MNNSSPINISMLNLIIPTLSFFILLLATTNADINLKPIELSLHPNSNPNTNANTTISPDDKKPIPHIKPAQPESNLKPATSPHDDKPVPNLKPAQPKPNLKPTTSPHDKKTVPDLEPAQPKPNLKPATSPHDKKPVPNLEPAHPKPNLKPTTSPHDKKPVPNLEPAHPKPNTKPTLPKPNLKPAHPKPNTKPGQPKPKPNPKRPNAASPYRSVNHFCRSRRLDVKTTFCLQVLRSSPASTKAKDNQALLSIAADAAIQFSNKRIASMKKMITSKEAKKMKPELKEAVEECVSAYEGYLKQFKTLVEEAGVEAQLASYDSELAKLEINRCVKALSKIKNAEEIVAENKVALDYARLSQNIADSI